MNRNPAQSFKFNETFDKHIMHKATGTVKLKNLQPINSFNDTQRAEKSAQRKEKILRLKNEQEKAKKSRDQQVMTPTTMERSVQKDKAQKMNAFAEQNPTMPDED